VPAGASPARRAVRAAGRPVRSSAGAPWPRRQNPCSWIGAVLRPARAAPASVRADEAGITVAGLRHEPPRGCRPGAPVDARANRREGRQRPPSRRPVGDRVRRAARRRRRAARPDVVLVCCHRVSLAVVPRRAAGASPPATDTTVPGAATGMCEVRRVRRLKIRRGRRPCGAPGQRRRRRRRGGLVPRRWHRRTRRARRARRSARRRPTHGRPPAQASRPPASG
jgi:hypothetical protein